MSKNKQKFKVGDRVRIVDATGYHYPIVAKEGVVERLDEDGAIIAMRNDNGMVVRYYMLNYRFKLLKEKHPVIVITSDGTTTTATMRQGKKVLKTATATCGRKNTFDFAEGARIAFERLQGCDPFPNSKAGETQPNSGKSENAAADKPRLRFHVGDRVRLTHMYDGHLGNVGDAGTIKGIVENCETPYYRIHLDKHSRRSVWALACAFENGVELIVGQCPEDPSAKKPVNVVCINTSGAESKGSFTEWRLYNAVPSADHDGLYRIKGDDGHCWWVDRYADMLRANFGNADSAYFKEVSEG